MLHWEFVRGKLRHDPLYFNLLRRGPPAARGDGCSTSAAAGGSCSPCCSPPESRPAQGQLPRQAGPAPPDLSFHGIEGAPRRSPRSPARSLAGKAEIETADLRTADLPPADAILLLDVLHYLPAADQEALLAKAAAALQPGGVLLLRDADAAAGWRFTATRLQERLSALFRRHWRQRFHYRSAAEWSELLERLGLTVDVQPMGMGTPYANVLLAGRK